MDLWAWKKLSLLPLLLYETGGLNPENSRTSWKEGGPDLL